MLTSYRRIVLCIVLGGAVAVLGGYLAFLSHSLVLNEQRLRTQQILETQASLIERRLSRSLLAAEILGQEVREGEGEFPHFDRFSEQLMQTIGGITNLQLVPGGVIEKIYPLQGNEKALGFDILNSSDRNREALAAIEQKTLTLAGPFELVQGGVAVIGREPVFLTDNGSERFWGFTAALIFLDDILSATTLRQLESQGYSYRLSQTSLYSGTDEVFARSSQQLTDELSSTTIEVPNANWTLFISRTDGAMNWALWFGYVASAIAGILVAWGCNSILKQPEHLRQVVREKTTELKELAFYDPLTGLANRRLLNEQLVVVLNRYKRNKDSGLAALLYLDLDDFKTINDSMGHQTGDYVLQEITTRLLSVVRASDIVARLGGDEFGILMQDLRSVDNLTLICKKLIAGIALPIDMGNKQFTMSASIGITLIPDDGEDAEALLRNADLAMYDAKRSGKNRYSLFNVEMSSQLLDRLHLEEQLVEGIAENQFVLFYQPLIDLQSGTVISYEALIRWQHPARGLLFPDSFISIAEESGLIIEMGYWVIEDACRTLAVSAPGFDGHQTIAVNLSAIQLIEPALSDRVRDILSMHNVDGSRLVFEITESVLMMDVERVTKTLIELRSLGIRIAIDDFGTGYSSLAYLKRLPIDKLKIDRCFIQAVASDSVDQRIVEAIIVMAHKLDLEVVAEGIEEVDQYHNLVGNQCNIGQGYWFCKPIPVEQIEGAVSELHRKVAINKLND